MLRDAVADCSVHGKLPGQMHDVQDSDGATAIGRDGTAPDGETAKHVHQGHQRAESGS